jgi:AAHS family 4-hydroxybenzoate transporter-like MFS transporter
MPNTTTLLSEYVPERSRALAIMFTGFNLGSALVGFGAPRCCRTTAGARC